MVCSGQLQAGDSLYQFSLIQPISISKRWRKTNVRFTKPKRPQFFSIQQAAPKLPFQQHRRAIPTRRNPIRQET